MLDDRPHVLVQGNSKLLLAPAGEEQASFLYDVENSLVKVQMRSVMRKHQRAYAAMRAVANGLDADVVAFQEAENERAAARVFDQARYTIVMETRAGSASGKCGRAHPEQPFVRQAGGFAIRKAVDLDRNADISASSLGNPQLRSGIDVTIRPVGNAPIRLLGVHLKSSCFQGSTGDACQTLLQQIPVVESWIDAATAAPFRFAVLGDWNRRLRVSGDAFWTEVDDGEPANADLRLADEEVAPKRDPRFTTFIDHIVLDKRAGTNMTAFA